MLVTPWDKKADFYFEQTIRDISLTTTLFMGRSPNSRCPKIGGSQNSLNFNFNFKTFIDLMLRSTVKMAHALEKDLWWVIQATSILAFCGFQSCFVRHTASRYLCSPTVICYLPFLIPNKEIYKWIDSVPNLSSLSTAKRRRLEIFLHVAL